jgi:hypothetical protein
MAVFKLRYLVHAAGVTPALQVTVMAVSVCCIIDVERILLPAAPMLPVSCSHCACAVSAGVCAEGEANVRIQHTIYGWAYTGMYRLKEAEGPSSAAA